MVLSQLQLAYFYYLKLSLILINLQNYRICESLFKSFKAQKKKKEKQQQIQQQEP